MSFQGQQQQPLIQEEKKIKERLMTSVNNSSGTKLSSSHRRLADELLAALNDPNGMDDEMQRNRMTNQIAMLNSASSVSSGDDDCDGGITDDYDDEKMLENENYDDVEQEIEDDEDDDSTSSLASFTQHVRDYQSKANSQNMSSNKNAISNSNNSNSLYMKNDVVGTSTSGRDNNGTTSANSNVKSNVSKSQLMSSSMINESQHLSSVSSTPKRRRTLSQMHENESENTDVLQKQQQQQQHVYYQSVSKIGSSVASLDDYSHRQMTSLPSQNSQYMSTNNNPYISNGIVLNNDRTAMVSGNNANAINSSNPPKRVSFENQPSLLPSSLQQQLHQQQMNNSGGTNNGNTSALFCGNSPAMDYQQTNSSTLFHQQPQQLLIQSASPTDQTNPSLNNNNNAVSISEPTFYHPTRTTAQHTAWIDLNTGSLFYKPRGRPSAKQTACCSRVIVTRDSNGTCILQPIQTQSQITKHQRQQQRLRNQQERHVSSSSASASNVGHQSFNSYHPQQMSNNNIYEMGSSSSNSSSAGTSTSIMFPADSQGLYHYPQSTLTPLAHSSRQPTTTINEEDEYSQHNYVQQQTQMSSETRGKRRRSSSTTNKQKIASISSSNTVSGAHQHQQACQKRSYKSALEQPSSYVSSTNQTTMTTVNDHHYHQQQQQQPYRTFDITNSGTSSSSLHASSAPSNTGIIPSSSTGTSSSLSMAEKSSVIVHPPYILSTNSSSSTSLPPVFNHTINDNVINTAIQQPASFVTAPDTNHTHNETGISTSTTIPKKEIDGDNNNCTNASNSTNVIGANTATTVPISSVLSVSASDILPSQLIEVTNESSLKLGKSDKNCPVMQQQPTVVIPQPIPVSSLHVPIPMIQEYVSSNSSLSTISSITTDICQQVCKGVTMASELVKSQCEPNMIVQMIYRCALCPPGLANQLAKKYGAFAPENEILDQTFEFVNPSSLFISPQDCQVTKSISETMSDANANVNASTSSDTYAYIRLLNDDANRVENYCSMFFLCSVQIDTAYLPSNQYILQTIQQQQQQQSLCSSFYHQPDIYQNQVMEEQIIQSTIRQVTSDRQKYLMMHHIANIVVSPQPNLCSTGYSLNSDEDTYRNNYTAGSLLHMAANYSYANPNINVNSASSSYSNNNPSLVTPVMINNSAPLLSSSNSNTASGKSSQTGQHSKTGKRKHVPLSSLSHTNNTNAVTTISNPSIYHHNTLPTTAFATFQNTMPFQVDPHIQSYVSTNNTTNMPMSSTSSSLQQQPTQVDPMQIFGPVQQFSETTRYCWIPLGEFPVSTHRTLYEFAKKCYANDDQLVKAGGLIDSVFHWLAEPFQSCIKEEDLEEKEMWSKSSMSASDHHDISQNGPETQCAVVEPKEVTESISHEDVCINTSTTNVQDNNNEQVLHQTEFTLVDGDEKISICDTTTIATTMTTNATMASVTTPAQQKNESKNYQKQLHKRSNGYSKYIFDDEREIIHPAHVDRVYKIKMSKYLELKENNELPKRLSTACLASVAKKLRIYEEPAHIAHAGYYLQPKQANDLLINCPYIPYFPNPKMDMFGENWEVKHPLHHLTLKDTFEIRSQRILTSKAMEYQWETIDPSWIHNIDLVKRVPE